MSTPKPQSVLEFIRVIFSLGLRTFLDRNDNITLIEKELVKHRGWVSRASFKYILEFCELIPGMQTQKIITHIGWYIWGIPGGILAGLLYVLPGALFLLIASLLYANNAGSWWCQTLYYGLGPAAIAILFHALVSQKPAAKNTRHTIGLSIASFVALYFLGVPFLIVFATGLAYGIVYLKPTLSVDRNSTEKEEAADEASSETENVAGTLDDVQATAEILESTLSGLDQFVFTILLLIFWLTPLVVIIIALGPTHPIVSLTFTFFQAVIFSFGEAQGIFAYIAEQTILSRFWLEPDTLTHAFALAEAFPGPPLLALQYIGFVIGFTFSTAGPLEFLHPNVAGFVGAFLGFWVTAIPAFLWIFTLAPVSVSVRYNPLYKGISQGAKSVLLGACGYLCIWLGLRVLFDYSTQVAFLGLSFEAPLIQSMDFNAAVLTIIALYIRMYLKKPNCTVVYICAPIGCTMQILERFSLY